MGVSVPDGSVLPLGSLLEGALAAEAGAAAVSGALPRGAGAGVGARSAAGGAGDPGSLSLVPGVWIDVLDVIIVVGRTWAGAAVSIHPKRAPPVAAAIPAITMPDILIICVPF